MVDVIEDLTQGLGLRSSLYFRAELSAPFAVAVPADGRRIRFHVAGAGRAWIRTPAGAPVHFGEGDLVLVPHGSAHELASAADGPARPLAEIVDGVASGVLRHGGGGASVELVCGHFAFDERAKNPLVDSLPALVHVPAGEPAAGGGARFDWMLPLLRAVEAEADGSGAVARRLSEVLFIQLLRSAVRHARAEPGLLGALADPQLSRALRAIHADPAADWSIEALAGIAGASRSVFAERFRRRAGRTPMRYLADLRIHKARGLLADPALSVGDVGRRVGYASEAAFSRAFRSAVGESPGRHRRARLARSA